MQSGISASKDLLAAFNTLVSEPSQRALLATISSETLVPQTTIPAESDTFTADLHLLQPHLKPNEATYILLKLDPTAPDGYAAITYIPQTAPVRQKMLFASTRLTLARELGLERFRQQIFTTEAAELTEAGWEKLVAHESLEAPLTEEEAGLKGVREAEAGESRGTGGRRGHVSGKVDVKVGDGVVEALRGLGESGLVQLKFRLPGEVLELEEQMEGVRVEEVGERICKDEPRYSFYRVPGEEEVTFVYTCPSSSKVRERMIYSTGKSWTRIVAERDAGVVVGRSLEATEPGDLTADMFGGGAVEKDAAPAASTGAGGQGFARPKRPGRR